ncbi:hypothetical protein P692DRAFT_201590497 [Suillus brevipes Sb2]|nr:hypothetical protein P692DRAFT_201590497 [Suillus brevipes Sb2]
MPALAGVWSEERHFANLSWSGIINSRVQSAGPLWFTKLRIYITIILVFSGGSYVDKIFAGHFTQDRYNGYFNSETEYTSPYTFMRSRQGDG